MAGAQIDDPSATKEASRAPGDFPGFVELLTREASGMTHRSGNAIEQGFAGESTQIAIGQAPLRGGGKGGQTNEKYSAAAK